MTHIAPYASQSETRPARRLAVGRVRIKLATLMVIGAVGSALAIHAPLSNGYQRSDAAVGESAMVSGIVFVSGPHTILQTSDSSIWVLEDGPSGAVKAMAQDGQRMCALGRVTSAHSKDKTYSLRLDRLQLC